MKLNLGKPVVLKRGNLQGSAGVRLRDRLESRLMVKLWYSLRVSAGVRLRDRLEPRLMVKLWYSPRVSLGNSLWGSLRRCLGDRLREHAQ